MARDIYQDVTNQIVSEIESGGFSGLPENSVTGRQYNGINTLILWLMGAELGYSSYRWCTYKQAKQAGACVRKGEKSIPVIFYKSLMKEVENSVGAMEEKSFPMIKVFNVFNIDQVDGLSDELPLLFLVWIGCTCLLLVNLYLLQVTMPRYSMSWFIGQDIKPV